MPINARLIIEQALANAGPTIQLSDAEDVIEALGIELSFLDFVFHQLQQAHQATENFRTTVQDGTALTALQKESYAMEADTAITEIVALQNVFGG